jgi:hypothetical protein
MGINVHVKDERGQIIGSALDPQMLLSRLTLQPQISVSRLLRYLDPAGDLVLNRAQAQVVLDDLADLMPTASGSTAALLAKVRELASQVAAGTHLYLWFEGD